MADVELLQPNMLVKNKAGEWRVIAYVNFDTDDGRPVVHYRTQFLPEFAEDVQLADPKDLELVEFYELCRRFRSNYHSWRRSMSLVIDHAPDPCLPPQPIEAVYEQANARLGMEPHPLAFWKQFLRSQMDNNMDVLVRDSIKDFHVPGFNYICFQFAPNMTIRLYITLPVDGINTGVINIHNHLYDSQMLCLAGGFTNHIFGMVPGDEFHYWHLTSALHPDNKTGRIRLDRLGKTGLDKISSKFYGPGMTHFQPHDEIHMVTTVPTRLNAFMIWEYATVKQHSMLFSKKDHGDTIPTPGAYNRFTADEIRDLLHMLLRVM